VTLRQQINASRSRKQETLDKKKEEEEEEEECNNTAE
jgi:hypothetical protein